MAVVQTAGYELLLVAAVGILLLGLEDLLFDAVWLARARRAAPIRPGAQAEGRLAIFVPAWEEAAVLPGTIAHMLDRWRGQDFRIYIGCYPNDGATLFAISALVAANPALRLVIAAHDGPTSKADNLNQMWQALGEDERALGERFVAVVLHDAEDVVHRDELAVYRSHIGEAAMVQIPVEPLILAHGTSISAHYADEFAEAHVKDLPLRSELGAGLPSAGVGCAFSRRALTLLALERPDGPFSADSLTEDYEAGLVLGANGLSCRFVRARANDGEIIAVRSLFPATLETAVRQKSRWIAGIAFAAWDRLDWAGGRKGGPNDHKRGVLGRILVAWMLWRDRRTAVAALITLAAYAALLLAVVNLVATRLGWWPGQTLQPVLAWLLGFNMLLLGWRLAIRAALVAGIYGWRQGLGAIFRAVISNIIQMMAARRGLMLYLRQLHSRELVWEKTAHDPLVPASAEARGWQTD